MNELEILEFIAKKGICPLNECDRCPISKAISREEDTGFYSCWATVLENHDSKDIVISPNEIYQKVARELLVSLIIEKSIEGDENEGK